jgi:hypothetical protein
MRGRPWQRLGSTGRPARRHSIRAIP